MRLGFRLAFWLIMGITGISLLFALYQVEAEYQGRRNELRRRAELLADSLQETVEQVRGDRSLAELQRIVDRFGNRERLVGIAVYDASGEPIAMTQNLPARLDPQEAAVGQAVRGRELGEFFRARGVPMYVYAVPVRRDGAVAGAVAVFHDASYIDLQGSRIWHDTALRVVLQVCLIAIVTLLMVRWSMMRPIARIAQWVHEVRA